MQAGGVPVRTHVHTSARLTCLLDVNLVSDRLQGCVVVKTDCGLLCTVNEKLLADVTIDVV